MSCDATEMLASHSCATQPGCASTEFETTQLRLQHRSIRKHESAGYVTALPVKTRVPHLGHAFPVEWLEVRLLERLGQLQHPVSPEVEDYHLCRQQLVDFPGTQWGCRSICILAAELQDASGAEHTDGDRAELVNEVGEDAASLRFK